MRRLRGRRHGARSPHAGGARPSDGARASRVLPHQSGKNHLAEHVGRPGFISDLVIDLAKNRIIYAHCVAPTKVFGPNGTANPFHLRDHSEDRKGAAIRALLPLGYLTSTMKFVPGKRQLLFH